MATKLKILPVLRMCFFPVHLLPISTALLIMSLFNYATYLPYYLSSIVYLVSCPIAVPTIIFSLHCVQCPYFYIFLIKKAAFFCVSSPSVYSLPPFVYPLLQYNPPAIQSIYCTVPYCIMSHTIMPAILQIYNSSNYTVQALQLYSPPLYVYNPS